MTRDDLISAGFKEYGSHIFKCGSDVFFQQRIDDEFGVRYFVEVIHWPANNGAEDWQVEVNFNDGAACNPSRAALRVLAFAGVDKWSAADVLRWADELWTRLAPNYYERNV
jgi:hypothetical protein